MNMMHYQQIKLFYCLGNIIVVIHYLISFVGMLESTLESERKTNAFVAELDLAPLYQKRHCKRK